MNAISRGKSNVGFVGLHNLRNLLRRQTRAAAFLTARHPLPRHRILNIEPVRPYPQMGGVAARRVIAGVEDVIMSIEFHASREHAGKPMGINIPSASSSHAAVASAPEAGPRPTLVRRPNINGIPKLLFGGFHACIIAILLSSCTNYSGGAGCDAWRPILIADADSLTADTARAILAHNRAGRALCGW